jgi:hypothetical protein
MIWNVYCFERIHKYSLLTALTILCLSVYVTSVDTQWLTTFEADTGLSFPQSVIDLACLASTFPSRFKQKHETIDKICFNQQLNNYIEIKQISGLTYDDIDQSFIYNTYPMLGIKGLHLKLIESKVHSMIDHGMK